MDAFQDIRLVIFDVDGVLTPGLIRLSTDGHESLDFHVHDGWGIKALIDEGYEVAIITGRDVEAVRTRCERLGIPNLYFGVKDKLKIYRELLRRLSLEDRQTCFVGDDLPDLPPMSACGLPIAVANARPEILEIAAHRTNREGGDGAAREVCELLLKAHGKWEKLLERLSNSEEAR